MTTDLPKKPLPLSPRQLKAIPILAGAASVTAGTEAAGISRKLYYRWLRNPEFAAAIEGERNKIFQVARKKLLDAVSSAVDVLVSLLKTTDSPWLQRSVALDILSQSLKLHELTDLEARLSRLENLIGKGK